MFIYIYTFEPRTKYCGDLDILFAALLMNRYTKNTIQYYNTTIQMYYFTVCVFTND